MEGEHVHQETTSQIQTKHDAVSPRRRSSLSEELQGYLDQYVLHSLPGYGSVFKPTGKALKRLLSRYSGLGSVDSYADRPSGSTLDISEAQSKARSIMLGNGLKSLPDEILLGILTLAVEAPPPSLAAMELSHVCSRFRKLTLGSRRLWSDIHPVTHSYRMVALYAARNRSLGLNVTLTNRHFSPNKPSHLRFLRAVVAAQANWQSLTIEAESRSVEELLDSLNAFRGDHPLPGLKHLCIKAARFYSQPFSEEEKSQIVNLYSSLRADNLLNMATTDLFPISPPPNLSQLTIYVHSRTNLSSTANAPSHRNLSVKELNLIFYFPENDNNQVLSGHSTSFDEVEVLRIQTPHVKKRGHIGSHILFTHLRLPKLRTLHIDYDFKVKYEAKPKDMDLTSLEDYYLRAPLFQTGLESLVLKLYKTCPVDQKHSLPIPFHKMPPVRELQIETPHPFASLACYMEGKPMPSFDRVIFHECENLTSEWLSGFVECLRRDDAIWNALDKIVVNHCPLVDVGSLSKTVPNDKLLFC